MKKVVAVLQARMGSARLPGKVLAPIAGRPMLEHIIRRAGKARRVDTLVVATTTGAADDAVAATAGRLGVPCVRGSEEDVLDRLHTAAERHAADIVVRLTGDNPLVDGLFIDMVVGRFLEANPAVDYADTTTSGTYPYGLSVEVVTRASLDRAWREADTPADREHVTLFVRQRPAEFAALHLRAEINDSDLRWTVDVAEDLDRVRRLFAELALDEPVDYREVVRHERRRRD